MVIIHLTPYRLCLLHTCIPVKVKTAEEALEVSNVNTTQDELDTDESDPNDKLMELPLDNDTLFTSYLISTLINYPIILDLEEKQHSE